MNNRDRGGIIRIVLVLTVFSAVLLAVGFLLKNRMKTLLTSYSENQTKLQAETYARLAAQELKTELDDLAYIASKLESHPGDMDTLMPLVYDEAGIRQGLLTIDGQAIYGEELAARSFTGIQASFRGNSAVSFAGGEGLLFTCPVFHGKNIRYVLYRLFPPQSLGENFSVSCYDGQGKLCVTTRDGEVIIPFGDTRSEDTSWFYSGAAKNCFASMHREMEVSVAAARTFSTSIGRMILFEAELPGTDYLAMGYVPEDVVMQGIESINLLVMWVFGLLMLLVLIGAFYLMRASVKLRESNALRKAKAIAEEASRAKSDFLANMSHEIRTPINAVLGMNEMILRETGDSTIRTYARNIKNAGNTLLGLINDILDFSRIEAGKIEILPVDYDLSVTINDLMNMIHTRADEKGLLMELDVDRETPRFLHGDETRIKQIITNILTNAVKYTEKGSVTFSVGYETIPEEPGSILLKVAVKDTGIGIKYEDMKKLFSEFERIEEKRNRNIEGTGLGMNITRSLLELMGSSLQVESVYGLGSTFRFALKQEVLDPQEKLGNYEEAYRIQNRSREAYREKLTAPDAAILVVDDNPMNLMVFKSLVKQTLVKVDTGNDGAEGIALAAGRKYDVIFLDHMMPGKDGIETLQSIRRNPSGLNAATPAVCLTANAISGAKEKYLEAGFDSYITKPIDPGQLENTLIVFLPKEKVKMTASGEEEDAAGREASEDGILDKLSGSADIDVTTGLTNSGSLEAYVPLLKVFYETIDERAGELEGFFGEEDFHDYTIKVHALKSSARIIGAAKLGDEAAFLEEAGKSGDTGVIREKHGAFMDYYRSFHEMLEPLFAGEEEEEKPEADDDLMQGVYEEIRSAAEDMDSDRLDAIFAEMEEYRIPAGEEERFGKLKLAAGKLDYEEIRELMSEER